MTHSSARITVIVDNRARAPLAAEHGLSLRIEYRNENFLFDTGAGAAFAGNLAALGIRMESLRKIILSHGHNDHTGALSLLAGGDLWCVPGVTTHRYSRHTGVPVRNLAMPPECVQALARFRVHETTAFTEIAPGVLLTGPIPRASGEDCGGPFFLDPEGITPDPIADEQAMLLDNGVLIQGCCHAGVINTLDCCLNNHPEIAVHTIAGGLHLQHASPERLEQTAEAFRRRGIRELILLHCTGDDAIAFLRSALPECRILTPGAGETIVCGN